MYCVGKNLALFPIASLLFIVGSGLYAATAEEALGGCKGFPDVDKPNTCRAYFLTILDGIGSDDKMINPNGPLCVDGQTSVAEIISIVVNWIESHPEQRSISLFDATHKALSPHFQCD